MHNPLFKKHLVESAELQRRSNRKRAISRVVPIEPENSKENNPPPEPSIVLVPVTAKPVARDVLMPNVNLQEPNCFARLIEVIRFLNPFINLIIVSQLKHLFLVEPCSYTLGTTKLRRSC